MQAIGQVIGIIAVIGSIFLYLSTDRKMTLILRLTSDLLWVFHYLMIGSYSATLTMTITIARELFLLKNVRSKWMVISFSFLFFLTALLTYSSPISIIPPISATISTVGLLPKNINRKVLSCSTLLMLVYGFFVNSYATVINALFTLISLFLGVLGSKSKKRNC